MTRTVDDGEAALMGGRPEPRADMRPDDPRARAAARAAELFGHGVMDADTSDKFAVDLDIIPDGWSYEWKRRTVYNAEDPGYQVALATTGWEPVPASRHPKYMPEGWTGNVIERDGLVLMERPKVVTDAISERDRKSAAAPVQAMEERLSGTPAGHFERKGPKGENLAKVGRTYEHIPIPD